MDTARHQISGLEVTAETALEDREAGWPRLRPPGFICRHCKWPAGLRRRGRGDKPFFFHYAHSPRDCPLLTEANAELEWAAREDDSPQGMSLAEVLFDDVRRSYIKALGKMTPAQIDLRVAEFLSYGIQSRRERYGADSWTSIFVANMLQVLYQPQYIVLLRWVCAKLAERREQTEQYWETVQEEFLSSDLAQSWYDLASLDESPISRVESATTPLDSRCRHRLIYSSFFGKMNCFRLNGSRVDVAEICGYPTTLILESSSPMRIGIARCRQGAVACIGELILHSDECTLTLSEPEAIILSPHYDLQDRNVQLRPFLYLLPKLFP